MSREVDPEFDTSWWRMRYSSACLGLPYILDVRPEAVITRLGQVDRVNAVRTDTMCDGTRQPQQPMESAYTHLQVLPSCPQEASLAVIYQATGLYLNWTYVGIAG